MGALAAAVMASACGETSHRGKGAGGTSSTPSGGEEATQAGAPNGGAQLTGGGALADGGARPVGADVGAGAGGEGAAVGAAGEGGEGGANDDGRVPISGVVVGADELPVVGAVLRVQGQTLTTGADGSFHFNVTTPYDLVLEQPVAAGSGGQHVAWLGLTRQELKLHSAAPLVRNAKLLGTVTGIVPNTDVWVGLLYGRTVQPTGNGSVDAGGHLTFDVAPWQGDHALAATLFAVQNQTTPSGVGEPVSLATLPIVLTSGKTLTTDLALAGPKTFHSLTFDAHQPKGVSFKGCEVAIEIAQASALYYVDRCDDVHQTIDVPDGLPRRPAQDQHLGRHHQWLAVPR